MMCSFFIFNVKTLKMIKKKKVREKEFANPQMMKINLKLNLKIRISNSLNCYQRLVYKCIQTNTMNEQLIHTEKEKENVYH